jgi:hypothetical protein
MMALLTSNNSIGPKKKSKWISGYLYDEKVVTSQMIENFELLPSLQNTVVPDKKLQYFNKIVALCNKNDIELVCVRSPFPPSRLRDNMDTNLEISNYFEELCNENKISFYDFNTIEADQYDYLDTDFSDSHHMNHLGATKASIWLAKTLVRK